jgi:hypothetical protein
MELDFKISLTGYNLQGFLFVSWGWCGTEFTIKVRSRKLRPPNGLMYQPRMMMSVQQSAEKPQYSEKSCPSAALSTSNPT